MKTKPPAKAKASCLHTFARCTGCGQYINSLWHTVDARGRPAEANKAGAVAEDEDLDDLPDWILLSPP